MILTRDSRLLAAIIANVGFVGLSTAHAQTGDELLRRWVSDHSALRSFEITWVRPVYLGSKDDLAGASAASYTEATRYRWPDCFVQWGDADRSFESLGASDRLGQMAIRRGILPDGRHVNSAPGQDSYHVQVGSQRLRDVAWQHSAYAPAILALLLGEAELSMIRWHELEDGAHRGVFAAEHRALVFARVDGEARLLRQELLNDNNSEVQTWHEYQDFRKVDGVDALWPFLVRSGYGQDFGSNDPVLKALKRAADARELHVQRVRIVDGWSDTDLSLDLAGMLEIDDATGEVRDSQGQMIRRIESTQPGATQRIRWAVAGLILVAGSLVAAAAWKFARYVRA